MNSYRGGYDNSVEIGHTYVPETVTPFTGQWRQEDTVELPIFEPPKPYHALLRELAYEFSERPLLLTLIDDVGKSSDQAFFTELSVLETLDSEDVYYESAYVDPAKELIDTIRGAGMPQGYRLSKDGRKIIVGSGKDKTRVPLVGFTGVDDPNHPSCQMLDAAWTLDRLQSVAPRAGNILPIEFSEQQMQVAALAKLIPSFRDFDVTTIFVDRRANVVNRYDWPLSHGNNGKCD